MSKVSGLKNLYRKTQSLAAKMRSEGYRLPEGDIHPKFFKLLTECYRGRISILEAWELIEDKDTQAGTLGEVLADADKHVVYVCHGLMGGSVVEPNTALYLVRRKSRVEVYGSCPFLNFNSAKFCLWWQTNPNVPVYLIVEKKLKLGYDLRKWPAGLTKVFFYGQIYNTHRHVNVKAPQKRLGKVENLPDPQTFKELRRANLRPSNKQLAKIDQDRKRHKEEVEKYIQKQNANTKAKVGYNIGYNFASDSSLNYTSSIVSSIVNNS